MAAGVLFALAVVASGAANAEVYPGPAPCNTTLQDCIDATPAGGTVLIATNGPISETISFTKGLTLEALGGFVPVFSAGASIYASSPTSGSHFIRIAGLHLEGGIIAVSQGSTESLSVEIVGNRASTGAYNAAIQVQSGTGGPVRGPVFFAIEDNDVSVQGGDAEAYGIALLLNDMADATGVIRDNRVAAQQIGQGAAIDVATGNRTYDVSIIRNRISGAEYPTGIRVFLYDHGAITARIVGNEVQSQPGSSRPTIAIYANDGNAGTMNSDVVNNTVVGSATGIVVTGRTDLGAVVTGSVVNNVMAGNQLGLSVDPALASAVPDRNNLFFGNVVDLGSEEEPIVPGPGTVFGDPLFAAPGNFAILPGSAAEDAGDSSALPLAYNVDLAGNPRVQGASVDIGAYEVPEPHAALAGVTALAALLYARRRAGCREPA